MTPLPSDRLRSIYLYCLAAKSMFSFTKRHSASGVAVMSWLAEEPEYFMVRFSAMNAAFRLAPAGRLKAAGRASVAMQPRPSDISARLVAVFVAGSGVAGGCTISFCAPVR